MKWVKRIVFSLLALVGIAIAALAIFIATFDVNSYKPRIQSEVEKATGRKLTLAGDASLKFSLSPTVALKDVSFANAAWSKDPQMATIGTLEVQMALLPLLDDQVVVNRLVVQDGAIVIETDAKGRGNWEFDAAANKPPSPASVPAQPNAPATPSASSGIPTIESVTLENTTVTYRDGVTKETHSAKVENFTFESDGADSPMDIAFKGIADNTPIELDAQLGSLNAILNDRAFDYDVDAKIAATSLKAVGSVEVPSQLKGLKSEIDLSGQSLSDLNSLAQLSLPGSKPFQLKGTIDDVGGNYRTKLDGQLGDSRASIDGTVIAPFTAPGFDGEISVDGKTLAEVGGLLATPLPDAGPYSVKGTVRQMGKDYAVDLKAALAETTSSLKGTFSNINESPGFSGQLTLDGKKLSDLNALTGGGLPERGPFSLAATAALQQNRYKLSNMTAAVEETQIMGDLSVAMDGKRPNIVATLKSPLIDMAKLAGAAADDGSTGGGGGGAGDGRVFSAEPLPLGWMETLDATASVAVTRLVTKSTTLDNLVFDGVLSDGKLTIRKLDGAMAGGNFSATGTIAAGQGAGVALQAILRNLDAVETQKLIGMDQLLSGSRINAAFDVKGSGNSLRSIMASLNGKTDLNISAGRINNRASEILMADLGKLLTLGGGGDNSALNCVVNRFAIQKGQAVSQVFVADTGGATIFGDGKVALDTERLDMKFAPKAKQANLVNFAVPVRVGGTLAHPTYAPDPLATAKGIAGAGLGIASGGGVGGAILGYVTGTGSNVEPGAGTDACINAVSGTQGTKPSGDLLDNVVDGVGGAAKDVGDAIENLFGN